ncbi:MAG: MFS transporter [Anaerolineales bacterium]|jgi:MFS family permease
MTDYSRASSKITFILFLAQSLTSAGIIATATVNSILGAKLGGAPLAGAPSAVFLLGGAVASLLLGILMDLLGRRNGIALGLLLGVLGSGLVVYAANQSVLLWMLAGMVMMGFANSAMKLGRFAAAEVHPANKRGAAISRVVFGGAVGAIVGPFLVTFMGAFSLRLGMDEVAGAYLSSLGLLALGSMIVFIGLRPDPRDLGEQIAEMYPDSAPKGDARPIGVILRQPAALTAVIAMVFGQMVMVAIMVITSLYMKVHNHPLSAISIVFAGHTFGMYAFSVLSGRLVDKWGRGPVILVGAATLILACLTAPLTQDLIPLIFSLFLLGLGWNFCFVGGSTLLADQLSPAERSRTQGVNDLLVGLASATGSLGSGLVYAATSYSVITLAAGALSLLPLVVVVSWMRRRRHAATSAYI